MLENKESITAKICAFARAHHSYFNREKIFDDYLAFDLLGDSEYEDLSQVIKGKLSDISPIPLSRIEYTERKLMQFAEANTKCQYIISGAGLDTFAFRNMNPNIEIFELDHPNTQRYKKKRIRELEWNVPKNVHFVPIDFEKRSIDEVMRENKYFDPKSKTFVAILGVAYYLSMEILKKNFESIANIMVVGSMLVFDYPDDSWQVEKPVNRVLKLRSMTADFGEQMTQGFQFSDLKDVLEEQKFSIVDYQTPDLIQKQYFENRNDNLRAFENVHFITAEYKNIDNQKE